MDPRIRNLTSTTFCGERLSRREIASIQETVQFFPHLSRTELGHTVCVQLGWQTPGGSNRLRFAMRVLRELERRGILQPLAALQPLQLQAVTAPREAQLWNHWVQRCHPLGYRQPIGTHLRYYVLDGRGRTLGCLLFDFATKSLPCRDRWIGWEGQAFRKRLHLVVRNSR